MDLRVSSNTTGNPATSQSLHVQDRVRPRTGEVVDSKTQSARLESLDLYRGLIMVIMLLDHVREWVHRDGMAVDPLALASTTPLLYFSRWITHLCAPGFVLLAGMSVGLQRQRGASVAELSRFLWTRGLVLIFIELVPIRLIVQTNLASNFLANLQVIWVIGVSMIVLAALIHLPKRVVLAIGLLIVCGHNLSDGIMVPAWKGPAFDAPSLFGKFWIVMHQGGYFPVGGPHSPIVKVLYPLWPWIGLIAIGYVMADMWSWESLRRRRALVVMSMCMVAAFVVLRATHGYGDNNAWSVQETPFKTFASFMNVQKYPASLQFFLITLAPSLCTLAWLDGRRFISAPARALITYGRVPMFYYLLQWTWARTMGVAITAAAGLPIDQFFRSRAATFLGAPPQQFGGTLAHVYVVWFVGVIVLYFPCRWFAQVKSQRKDLLWLRYF